MSKETICDVCCDEQTIDKCDICQCDLCEECKKDHIVDDHLDFLIRFYLENKK